MIGSENQKARLAVWPAGLWYLALFVSFCSLALHHSKTAAATATGAIRQQQAQVLTAGITKAEYPPGV
jgi:hypothetical protein